MNELTVKIMHDEDPESPRGWDNLGVMAGFHGRYNLGDNDPGLMLDGSSINLGDYDGWDEMEADLRRRGALCIQPLFLYDHSGITISTRSFAGRAHHASWDSGRVGFIFTTRKRMTEYLGKNRLTAKTRKRVEEILEAEVEEYDQYLRGDVYGYIIEDNAGNQVDSCWGFYGYDIVKQEAASQIMWYVENELDVSYA